MFLKLVFTDSGVVGSRSVDTDTGDTINTG